MSQKKVDLYKDKKQHRAQVQKKEKRMERLEFAAIGLVCLAIVGWIGYSAYGKVTSAQDSKVQEYTLDTTAVDEYLGSLSEGE